jgi:hypothetical protein
METLTKEQQEFVNSFGSITTIKHFAHTVVSLRENMVSEEEIVQAMMRKLHCSEYEILARLKTANKYIELFRP